MIGRKHIMKFALDNEYGRKEYEKIVNDETVKVLSEETFHTNKGEAFIIVKWLDTAYINIEENAT